MKFLNYIFPKRKALLELKLIEERESFARQIKDQQCKLEQSITVRHKQEIDLIDGKSELAIELAHYKKLLATEKQIPLLDFLINFITGLI